MSVMVKGKKSGFNRTGSNDVTPNFMGPPETKFNGRGGMPAGEFKRFPGAVADVSGGNRRLAKAAHGEGGTDGVKYRGHPTSFLVTSKNPK